MCAINGEFISFIEVVQESSVNKRENCSDALLTVNNISPRLHCFQISSKIAHENYWDRQSAQNGVNEERLSALFPYVPALEIGIELKRFIALPGYKITYAKLGAKRFRHG